MKPVQISHDASALLGTQLFRTPNLCGRLSDGTARRQRGSMQCVAMVTTPVST